MVYGRWQDQNGHFIDTSIIYTEDCTIFDPTEEQLIAAGYVKYEEPVYEPTEEEKLGDARIEKINDIKEYDDSPEVNSFTIGEQSMWLDFDERSRIKTSLEAYEASGAETMTKWFNDTPYTFEINQWKQMLTALEIYASEALNVTKQHIANVHALATVEDIEAYDYTTGYPTKLQF